MCGVICGEAMEEVTRRPHGNERFCFHCRAKRQFEYVVMAPTELSYYGPTPAIECATCRTVDGDLFPGNEREWED
jgi:hypothetical protein